MVEVIVLTNLVDKIIFVSLLFSVYVISWLYVYSSKKRLIMIKEKVKQAGKELLFLQ